MGSGIYEDIIVDDARLGIECLVDALYEKNSYALNYHPVIDLDYKNGEYHLSVQDSILQNDYQITCKNLIMTTGPFSNPLLKKWNLHPPVIKPSKGVHLWFDHEDLPISSPLVFQTPDQRILFLIPQRSHVLVGTTDTPFQGKDLFNPQVTDHDINYLFTIMHEFFHDLKISPKDIKGSFAGLRPLVPQNIHIQNSSKISRKHQIFQFHPNGYLLVGGKYTTFRVMAQDLMFKMYRQLGIQYNPTLSLNKLRYQPLYRPDINHRSLSVADILKIIENEQVKTLDDLLLRRLSFIGLSDKRLGPIKKILSQLKSEYQGDLEPLYQLIV
jgi:glycerol-3-phosphate dehydrogenase